MIPAWAIRHLPSVAAAVAAAAAVWWLVDVVSDRTRLRGELEAERRALSAAEAVIEQAEEAARVHRAHLARAADEARRWDALSRDLQQMEGRNAPLSPLLRATAERLYSSGH